MTQTHPEKRLIAHVRVSIYGETLDSQLERLRQRDATAAKICREKVTGARAAEFCRTDPALQGHRDDQPGRRPGRAP
jgi:hypothetical protein